MNIEWSVLDELQHTLRHTRPKLRLTPILADFLGPQDVTYLAGHQTLIAFSAALALANWTMQP